MSSKSIRILYKINFSALTLVNSIKCYVCNSTDTSQPFQCSEWFERYDRPDIEPVECSEVHGAKYCIKHIGRFEGFYYLFSKLQINDHQKLTYLYLVINSLLYIFEKKAS